ncbi:hypothetical protein MNEG_15499 [Monoraphidium neglectum]|uniref:Uncharacterized protein n=1 Tax=Monoraphidium neglectum TaxID=145388 RepID=A0A0D2LKL4_9CHLO|nr:hypothetical protein MNEG_15499 [Monoraphidium neglectum]KIY92464.1 hypothetical protein MNEG_15499 [Monoraphidium neglectum]|eukprot:XP_013891484.1 hypothetical protein MNEG_15499 [Monoraphidium neglectum]
MADMIESLMPASLFQEGLGSGALQEFLDSIDKQAEQIKLSLLAAVGEQVQQQVDIDPALLSALVSLASVSPSPGGPEAYIADYARKYMELQEQVKSLQAELKAAQAAADLEATLREFRQFLENGQYNDAAWSVVQLRKIVADARAKKPQGAAQQQQQQQQHYYGYQPPQQQQQQEHDEPEVKQLAEACASCERELEEALEAACQEAVDVSLEGRVLTVTAALPSGGDNVLPPVLDGSARFDAHTTRSGDSAIIKWAAVPRGEPATPSAAGRVEADCTQLLRVLADALFRGRATTLAAFGAAFWPGFASLYQSAGGRRRR